MVSVALNYFRTDDVAHYVGSQGQTSDPGQPIHKTAHHS